MFPAIPHLLLHVPLPGFTGLRGQDVHTFLHLGSVDGDGQEGITALEKLPRSPKLDSQSTQEGGHARRRENRREWGHCKPGRHELSVLF